MTQSKHTQEQWCYSPDYSAIVINKNHKLLHLADFGKVDPIEIPACEVKANAQLMAAAPELLEALQDVSESLQSFYDSHKELAGQYFGACLFERMKATIAKAKGEL